MKLTDMPHLRKKLAKYDKNRLIRLKEAKENKDIRTTVQMWAEEKLTPKILTDKQRQAIYYLTDFNKDYTDEWVAAKINVSVSTIHYWRNNPLFIRELDKEITRRRSYMRLHAFRNVHAAIRRGDMKATWNYLKMSGDLKENVEFIDKTGEKELSDAELTAKIEAMEKQLNVPSSN